MNCRPLRGLLESYRKVTRNVAEKLRKIDWQPRLLLRSPDVYNTHKNGL